MSSITRLDYCHFLFVSQINYTLTYFADHTKTFCHDTINRYLGNEHLPPRLVWEKVKDQLVVSDQGYIVFDDTVLDKNYSFAIELVRSQYSGNAHQIIKGIGVVNCVYVNPEIDQFWIIDYRIYNPEGDGKSKLHHVKEMLQNVLFSKHLPFKAVLMDSWYAVKWLMLLIESWHNLYYCPVKSNRLVNESGLPKDYHRVDALSWNDLEQQQGKQVHLKDFPKGHVLKLFCLPFSTERTDYVVTNDNTSLTLEAVQEACGFPWKVEQFHRETKQLTGIQDCQCRKQRIQRNHIACAMLVWTHLKKLADQAKTTLYQIKYGLLENYMIQTLKNQTLKPQLA